MPTGKCDLTFRYGFTSSLEAQPIFYDDLAIPYFGDRRDCVRKVTDTPRPNPKDKNAENQTASDNHSQQPILPSGLVARSVVNRFSHLDEIDVGIGWMIHI